MDYFLSLQALTWLLALIFSCLCITWASKKGSKKQNQPPEPAGRWPVLGHLHLLGGPKPVFKTLGDMADKYGPTFALRLGAHRMLTVSSWEAVKDCFTTNDLALSTRPKSSAAELMGYNYAMFGFAPYGPYWRQVRKIATLELLSSARLDALSPIRATEIDARVKGIYERWRKNGGKPAEVDLKSWFGDMNLGVVAKMVVGKRCYGNEERRFRESISSFFHLIGVFEISDVVPWLKWFDFKGYKGKMKRTAAKLDSVLGSWMEEHRKKKLSGGNLAPEDFMDVMLSIVDDDHGDQLPSYDRDTIIKATCMALVLGGTDTTSVTLSSAMAYVGINPHVLEKAQDEVDSQVGPTRKVEESDIKNLPYIQAIIKETLRLSPAAPISVPREATSDCVIDGFHVSRGTRVTVNIWKLHRDPRVWSHPSEFRPERFLNGEVNFDVRGQHPEYTPFGSGRRSCPGTTFALQVMHLALARLVHAFDFQMASSSDDLFDDLNIIGAHSSNAVKAVFTPRLSPSLYES